MESDCRQQQPSGAKHWELMAARLHAAGWSYGIATQRTESGVLLHCVDAHQDDGRRFIVHSDELLTAFLELEQHTKTLGL